MDIISIKFYGSIAAAAWTNWLRFELDPDHSPDPGTGFTPDFWILAGYMKKLWTDFVDFDEILCVDSRGGLDELIRFWGQVPNLHRIFLILAGYLKKSWTDFDEILWVDSCGGLHDLVTFWAGSESASWIRTCIQNYKADSAKSNGLISIKFYESIACESRKTALNSGRDSGHIRDAVSVSGFYPDYWLRLLRILTKFGAEMAPTTGKSWVSCRSSRS